jgi:hypothetical protein
MDGQRARLVTRTLDRVPTIRREAPVRTPQASGRLTRTWAGILGFGWPLAFVVSIALEPAPADPEAAVALIATAVAAGKRHPSAAVAGVIAGLIALGFTVTCPVSGHHTFGAWWFAQMGLTLAMLAVSAAALGGRAREPA